MRTIIAAISTSCSGYPSKCVPSSVAGETLPSNHSFTAAHASRRCWCGPTTCTVSWRTSARPHLDERDLAGDEELVAHDIGVSVAGRWGQADGLLIGVRGRQPVMRDPSIARR